MPSAPGDQLTVLNSLPGSASSSCAATGSHTYLRAGSVAAGDFAMARQEYAKSVGSGSTPQVELRVIPEHTHGLRSSTVYVTPIAGGPTKTVTSRAVEPADQFRYVELAVPIPKAGSYRLTMVAGPDRGCFVTTFRG